MTSFEKEYTDKKIVMFIVINYAACQIKCSFAPVIR